MSNSTYLPVETLTDMLGITFLTLAERMGVHDARIHECRRAGGFTPFMADKAAVACGLTPDIVWGADWWHPTANQIAQSEYKRRHRLKKAGKVA